MSMFTRMGLAALLSFAMVATAYGQTGTPEQREAVAAAEQEKAEAAASAILLRPAQLTLQRTSLYDGLLDLQESSGVSLVFSPSGLPRDAQVQCECSETTVEGALDRLLAGTGLRYSVVDPHILIEPRELQLRSPGDYQPRVQLASSGLSEPRTRRTAMVNGAAIARATHQEGTITGRVVDARTDQPLSGAQVFVPDTGAGTLTNADGEFTLSGVAAGEVTVRVQMIGYGAGTQSVSVVSGETVAANFELREQALGLDEIVVTGTAGGSQRRAVGTSMASIDVEETMEGSPISTVSDLLRGRQAGVVSTGASGTVGDAGALILRGPTSMSQNNRPLIYMDGIRLEEGMGTNRSGVATDRLRDINPQDIDRVEIIRGASATTLYGSEASGGVIQIFTKRGVGDTPQITLNNRLGTNQIPRVFPLPHPDPTYPSMNDLLETGLHQEYNLSIRGASGPVNYFASGSFLESGGSIPGNRMGRQAARLNLGFLPAENTNVDMFLNVTSSDQEGPITDNVVQGLVGTVLGGDPVRSATEDDPFGGSGLPVWYALSQVNSEETFRAISGATITQRLGSSFRHRLALGLDRSDLTHLQEWEYTEQAYFPGSMREITREENLRYNVDYSASVSIDLATTVGSETSVGGQIAHRDFNSVGALGSAIPARGLHSLEASLGRNLAETALQYSTGGLFVQQQFDFANRLYLIGGVRVDGSSVFGEDFGLQAYPKASISYVISDEAWFSLPYVSSLRLRSGYGLAGNQPGAFDAIRTFSPFRALGGAAAGFRPNNLGNPTLAPEVTSELEGGFDVGLFNERATLAVTAYRQRTADALVDLAPPPSTGFLQTQVTNVGAVSNTGLEVSLDGTIIAGSRFSWSADASYAYNRSSVEDIGGQEFIIDQFGNRIREGYPLPSKWERIQVGTDERGFPIASDTAVYTGAGFAPHNGSLRTDLTVGNIRAFANAQFALGHVVSNLGAPWRFSRRVGEDYWQSVLDADGDENAIEVERQLALTDCCRGEWHERADWMKLREVGLTYNLPDSFAPWGARARLHASATNLFTVTGYSGTDPEISAQLGNTPGTNLSIGSEFSSVPQSRSIRFGLDIEF